MEDVWRVEPPDASVESYRDLPRGGLEKLLRGGTEHASACYFSEEACVHSAFINCNLGLQGSKTKLSADSTDSIARSALTILRSCPDSLEIYQLSNVSEKERACALAVP
jgi:hypothetical protein